jgi:hypothetical protein
MQRESALDPQREKMPLNLDALWPQILQTAGNNKMVRGAGFEPTTYGSGGRRSIQLSYPRINNLRKLDRNVSRLFTDGVHARVANVKRNFRMRTKTDPR